MKINRRFSKVVIGLICLVFSFILPSPRAFAHRVNIFAYREGDMVYTESYFPDGKKVREGLVEVFDSRGDKLLEGRTDGDGRFSFKASGRGDLKIVINASLGHKNFFFLPAPGAARKIQKSDGEDTGAKERPIRREPSGGQRNEVSLTEIVGGIGYIVGLTGIIFYFLGRKRQR